MPFFTRTTLDIIYELKELSKAFDLAGIDYACAEVLHLLSINLGYTRYHKVMIKSDFLEK